MREFFAGRVRERVGSERKRRADSTVRSYWIVLRQREKVEGGGE